MDALKVIIEQEEWSMDKLGSLSKRMFSSQTQAGVIFNSIDFDNTLQHFVPPRQSQKGLKLSHHYEKHDSYHPISLYKELFTAASIPTRRVPLRRISPQNRTRSLSYAGGLNTRMLEKPVHHQRSLQRLFKRRSLHREMKAEKEAGRGMTQHSHQRRYSKSINHSVNLPSGGEVAPYSGGTKSREEMWMYPKSLCCWRKQSPFIAVDRRLAERLQCWSGLNSNSISINGNGQLMPSYLILNTPVCDDSKDEVMELYALEIGVHWIAGCKPKVLPTEGVITDTGVPKNPQLFVPPFSLAYGGANEMPTTSGKKWPARKRFASTIEEPGVNPRWRERKRSGVLNSNTYTRSISVPGKNWSTFNLDCIYVLPEKLSGQSLRFAFSRCHTILEVCEVVGKAFSDYRNHDLTPDTYRVWFVKTAESADASRQKPKLNPITKPASNSSDTNTSDDEKDNGNNLLAKRICLAPVDFKAIGDQQLGRFLADQDPSVLHNGELFDIYGKCSKKFEFVIECLQQANSWPLGQRPSEGGPFVGLKNMGNTCYFNSVIQCLRVTPLLEDRIRSLANEYLKLLDQMMQEGSANPRILWDAFVQKVPTFRSSVQQDAHEFLIIFLDLLNEELKQKHAAPKDGTLKPHDSRRKSTITNNSCAAAQGAFFVCTVVPSYVAVPEKCRLESDHSITLDFLRQQVSRRYKCLPSQVFLGQYCNEILTDLHQTERCLLLYKIEYWLRMCRGCPIPCTSEKVDLRPSGNGCIYIAADWSLDEFINEYQPTQAVGVKVADKIGSSDSDAANAIRLSSLLQKFFEEELGFHATNRGWRKSSNLVHFPLTSLDMKTYLSKEAKCENTIYDLYGVVNHMGRLDAGHYYAFIRVEDGRWFRVNDMQYSVRYYAATLVVGIMLSLTLCKCKVTQKNSKEVREESVVTPDAYILFYRRRHSAQHFQAH
eukprot:TsM_000892900 transcript=TsM_000892900 gene=TsM_000892900